jgi:hypothetical protein
MAKMTEYAVVVEATTIGEFEQAVSGEEAGASAFVKSAIALHDGRMTNIATFKTLPPGTKRKGIHVLPHGTAKPTDTTLVWAGVLLLREGNTAVSVYRANS